MSLLPSSFHQIPVSLLTKLKIALRRFLGLLLEGVKDVDRLRKTRDVEHSVLGPGVQPDLFDAWPYIGLAFQSFDSRPSWTRRNW
jgi:hypothetical protein